jgi:hypothetical protein
LGIGTASPQQQIHVYRNTTDGTSAAIKAQNAGASASYALFDATAGSVQTILYSDAAGNALGVAGASLRTATNHPLIFGTNNTERARIDSSGTLITSHNIREQIYNLTGTDINPVNGSVQYKTLAATTTFTESLADGDSVILRLAGGDTYAVTWPTMTWVTSAGNAAPTLGGSDVVVLWQESSTVYGAYVGSYA